MYRCDLCSEPSRGDTFHTYITPREVETVEEAERTGKFWCEDPEWAVCAKCKPLVDAGDFNGLLDRNSAYARKSSVMLAPADVQAAFQVDYHQFVAQTIAVFLQRQHYGYGPPHG